MKLGLVGTGMIVRSIAPHLASWGIEVGAIAGTPRSHDTTVELAGEYGASAHYDDYHELVRDEGIDTVYVGVPNFLH